MNNIFYLSSSEIMFIFGGKAFCLHGCDYNASECAMILGAAGCGMIFAQGAGCGWFLYYETQSHS